MKEAPGNRLRHVADLGLADLEFQQRLIEYGVIAQDPSEIIAQFGKFFDNFQHIFTPRELDVLMAHQPFGCLTSIRLVAKLVFGYTDFDDRQTCRVTYSRAISKIPKDLQVTLINRSNLRGIGCSTKLTCAEFAMVYLLSQNPQETTYPELTVAGITGGNNPPAEAIRYTRALICNINRHTPSLVVKKPTEDGHRINLRLGI